MAHSDKIEILERRESWNTTDDDNTSDVGSEGSSEWPIATDPPSSSRYYINPFRKLRIQGRRRSLFRLARSRPLYRLGCLLVLAAVQAYLLHRDYFNALAAKFSPTVFARISTDEEHFLARPRWQLQLDNIDHGQQDASSTRRRVLDGHAQWNKLGSGYEGDTFAFNGTVIKVFKPDQSPLRNCVPGTTTSNLAWPPEIPVSLLLGGLANEPTTPDDAYFVPILDYFLRPTAEDESIGEWHLVTPFLSSGTLDHLAKRLRHHEPSLTTDEIDAHFRPSFHRILEALDIMHSQRDLCHDDVKMDNIFVRDYTSRPLETPGHTNYSVPDEKDTHWLLGDLGNAREPSHAYHASLLWSHDNGQHPDCRVNDLRRLVKSYILFLQAATKRSVAQRDVFVQSFLAASAPWSRLYWYTMNKMRNDDDALERTGAARHFHDVSATVFSPVNAEVNMVSEGMDLTKIPDGPIQDEMQRLAAPNLNKAWFDHRWLGIDDQSRRVWAVGRELGSGLGLSEKWAKIFGTMGILRTPTARRRC